VLEIAGFLARSAQKPATIRRVSRMQETVEVI